VQEVSSCSFVVRYAIRQGKYMRGSRETKKDEKYLWVLLIFYAKARDCRTDAVYLNVGSIPRYPGSCWRLIILVHHLRGNYSSWEQHTNFLATIQVEQKIHNSCHVHHHVCSSIPPLILRQLTSPKYPSLHQVSNLHQRLRDLPRKRSSMAL